MKKIIIGSVGILLVASASWYLIKHNPSTPSQVDNTKAQAGPADVTLSFYKQWLTALNSTTTDPFAANILDQDIVSVEVRTMVNQKHVVMKKDELDPVMCQVKRPQRVKVNLVYATTTEAQVLVLGTGGTVKSQQISLVTLGTVDGAWQIKKIECSNGEAAPVSEFDFEQTGSLLKGSAKPPLDPKNIYLTFKKDTEPENTIQLFFTASSLCVAKNGTKTVCNPAQLTEGTSALIQASMTEEGAVVKKLTLQ
jgi:hypothetical protein